MASYTFYPAADGYLMSRASNWAAAQAGTGTISAYPSQATMTVGKLRDGDYYVYQAFLGFDTSAIPDGAVVADAILSVVPAVSDGFTWTLQARAYDWGGSITGADWRTKADWDALTLLAAYAMSGGWSSGSRKTLAQYGTNLNAAVNLSGSTRLILASSDWTGIAPSGDSATQLHAAAATGTTNDPRLEVTTVEPPAFTPQVMWIA